jgi:prepilin-type N-terminal cleavage/methylation domain-containing protein
MKQRGFTLIELLIVVAIIAILAAIAVPNFLEAQTRSKVARTKADMRSLATAIEAYRTDSNKYAPMNDKSPGDPAGMDYWSFTDASFHSRMSNFLTTPIAYISSTLEDIFIPQMNPPPFSSTRYPARTRVGYRYTYFNYQEYYDASPTESFKERQGMVGIWMFYSWGPDKHPNFSGYNAEPKVGSNSTYTRYDPSNGTISIGNIIRTGRSPEGSIPYSAVIAGLGSTMNGQN